MQEEAIFVGEPVNKPVVFQVEHLDGFWVYRNEQLGLWGYAERREDAIRDLWENFVLLWQAYAEEKDEVLDEFSLGLKQRLLALRE
jgi:hypothetical protein